MVMFTVGDASHSSKIVENIVRSIVSVKNKNIRIRLKSLLIVFNLVTSNNSKFEVLIGR